MNHQAIQRNGQPNVVRLDEYLGERERQDQIIRQRAHADVLRQLSDEPDIHAIVCSAGVGMDPSGQVRRFVTEVYPEDAEKLIGALLGLVRILRMWGRGEEPSPADLDEAMGRVS